MKRSYSNYEEAGPSQDYNDDEPGYEDDEEGLEDLTHLVPKAADIYGFEEQMDVNTLKKTSCHDYCSSFFEHDFGRIVADETSSTKPLWLSPDGRIYVETFSPLYKSAKDFLIAIAEPVCRPDLIHEYRLTSYSLYAAASIGLETDDILKYLEQLSKIPLTESVKNIIRSVTDTYGKVRLVLKDRRYFVESTYIKELQRLLREPVILNARITPEEHQQKMNEQNDKGFSVSKAPSNKDIVVPGVSAKSFETLTSLTGLEETEKDKTSKPFEDEEEQEEESARVFSFEVDKEKLGLVKQKCIEIDIPLVEEYDFKNDNAMPSLEYLNLKPTTVLRPYQEASLAKLFGNGRGRSGIIVLPCGAGKTLTGVTIACTIKKSCLVLCTSAVAVEQWEKQFLLWSMISSTRVIKFISGDRNLDLPFPAVCITTYHMLAKQGSMSIGRLKMMNYISKNQWGLLCMDEVHVVPALMFRRAMERISCHCKVGLTATLVREDEKTTDLNYLIGPKLYEANWMELQNNGYIAKVKCSEVWCPMAPTFFDEYLKPENKPKRILLWTMNPNKYRAVHALINHHSKQGDKIIVFSDCVFALEHYAHTFKAPYIFGGTSQRDRKHILDKFISNKNISTIFLSKIGDNSIDLPDANVLIQIASHFGARRQEAQRLGRILRKKKGPVCKEGEYNAFFYDIVSCDTREMFYANKRQQFLVDQGYAFEVITDLKGINDPELVFSHREDRLALLDTILGADDSAGLEEVGENDVKRRKRGRMGNYSGSSGAYGERKTGSGVSAIAKLRKKRLM